MGKKFVIMFIAVLLLLSSLSLVSAQAGTWKGFVKISNATGNNITAQAGTVVEGYFEGVLKIRVTVKNDSSKTDGYYVIDIPGNTSGNVTFKVWNVSINGINSNPQPWGVGIHPDTSPESAFNLTISTLAAGSTCTWSNACTGDYCCNGGTECNGRCTGTCQASACAAATSSSSSGGGGGGSGTSAGGGGSTTITPEETASVPSVSPSSSSSFTFAKSSDLSVSEIVLTATETVTNNPSITVKTTTFSGAAPVSSSSGSVYKYLLITKLNINDNQIGKATVKFKVEKKWLKDNKIDSKTVKLNRLVNGVWQELATKKLGEDSTNAEYEAETPGFSTFAISGLKQAKPTTAFGIIDEIRAYYAGSSVYSAFELIDIIRAFYAGG